MNKKILMIGLMLILVLGIIIGGIPFLEVVLVIALVVVGIILYFLPTIIAYEKQHENKIIILLLNFLFGWTLIGWIAILIWSCIVKKDNNNNSNISTNKYEDLERLQKLKESGAITDVEFELEKAKLLK